MLKELGREGVFIPQAKGMTSRVRDLPASSLRHIETLQSATSLCVCSNHSSVTPAAAMSNLAWEHRAEDRETRSFLWRARRKTRHVAVHQLPILCGGQAPKSPGSVSDWNAGPPPCSPFSAISETFANSGRATATLNYPHSLPGCGQAGTIPPDSHTLKFLASARMHTMLKLRNSAACFPVTPQHTTDRPEKKEKNALHASFGHCFCRHRGANRLYNLSR